MSEADKLKKAYEDIVWMAIRYANGRASYAPSMVRDSIKSFREVFPDWSPKEDKVVLEDAQRIRGADLTYSLSGDFLDDLFKIKQNNEND